MEVPTDAFGRGRVHQNPLSLSHPTSVVWLARVSSVCLGGVPRVGRRRDFEARVLYCGASESRTWGVGLHSGGQPHGAFGRDPGRLKSDVTRAPPPPVLAGPVGGTCGAPPLRVDGSVTLLPLGLPGHQPEGSGGGRGPRSVPPGVCVPPRRPRRVRRSRSRPGSQDSLPSRRGRVTLWVPPIYFRARSSGRDTGYGRCSPRSSARGVATGRVGIIAA